MVAAVERAVDVRHIDIRRRCCPNLCDTLSFLTRLGRPYGRLRDQREYALAKPNYQFEKRQRELEKKRKQEEKRQLALAAKAAADSDAAPASTEQAAPTDADGSGNNAGN